MGMKMKHVLILIFMISILSSCQKNLDIIVTDPNAGPDTSWCTTITETMQVSRLREDLRMEVFADSFQLNAGAMTNFQSASGLSLSLMGGDLITPNNQPYFGLVKMKSILLNSIGDMVRMGAQTTSYGELLETGGAFDFNLLSSNNEPLAIKYDRPISIKYQFAQPSIQGMQVFKGDMMAPPASNWILVQDSFNFILPGLGNNYEVITNQMRWINCDQFVNTPSNQLTKLAVVLPSNYTNANTIVFTSFDNRSSVVGMRGNPVDREFQSENIPVNEPVTVSVISKQGGNYFLGHLSITTTFPAVGNFQHIAITPVITNLNNINTYISTL